MLVPAHFERFNMWSNMLTIIFKIGSRYLRWMRLNVRDRDCERAVPRTQYAEAAKIGERGAWRGD